MSSKFNIELARGTITVEGDQEFIMSVYQALQSTLLSEDMQTAAPAPAETGQDDAAPTETPEPEAAPEAGPEPVEEGAVAEGIFEQGEAAHDENVTPITAAEAEPEPAAPAAPVYEPIPSVLDPDRAERERAEAEAAEETSEEASEQVEQEAAPAPVERNVVLEQIKDSLDEDDESGGQTSILQRIRDSLSEDAGKAEDEAEEAHRAADAG